MPWRPNRPSEMGQVEFKKKVFFLFPFSNIPNDIIISQLFHTPDPDT